MSIQKIFEIQNKYIFTYTHIHITNLTGKELYNREYSTFSQKCTMHLSVVAS
jgi:predicted nucleic-acid-binding Zn-ribbon protein